MTMNEENSINDGNGPTRAAEDVLLIIPVQNVVLVRAPASRSSRHWLRS
jgi:hypothetical protein